MNFEFQLGRSTFNRNILVRNLSNFHVFATGRSGSGKSYFLKHLAEQAAQQGGLVLDFDYTGDFRCYNPPDGLFFQRISVTSQDFSLNPLLVDMNQSADICAQQLLNLMRSIFRFGPRAATALRLLTQKYLSEKGLPTLHGLLDYAKNQPGGGRGLAAALEPLELFASLVHCGEVPLSLNLSNPGLVVLDFAQVVDQDLRKFLVELLLRAIWDQRMALQPSPKFPLVLLLDECQNLSWGEGSMSKRILNEGRKYGFAGWFSTQNISVRGASALSQADLQAYFRPDVQNVEKLAKLICRSEADLPQWRKLIQSLQVGQFLFRQSDGQCVLVNVDP